MRPSTLREEVRHAMLVLSIMLLAVLLLPGVAYAQDSQRIVRVGWFESPFNITDEQGRRSGYSYDYQQKLAAYTGWTYEYVEGGWPDLLQMLQDGKIDLLSDVSYTAERAERMLYSSLPMGAEAYYLYATPGNQEISSEDYSTLDGKKVGANKGSVQIGYFRDWAQANGVNAEVVELTGSEEDNLAKLTSGDIDLFLSMDGFIDRKSAVPICKVGSSDYFFVVSKTRPELLAELNGAMNRIQEENQYFNERLYAKYLQASSVNNYLNANEKAWIAEHGAIRVGYQDNYLAFCAQDPKTGELTGALKDCLGVASENFENGQVDFEPVCFPTAASALEAMKAGEVDCVFPANLTDYDGEVGGVFMTPALMRTDMSAVIRASELEDFSSKEWITVAVNANNPNYDVFLKDHFPEWRAIYFADTQECLKAVADGQADCVLISNYRFNNIAKLCDKYGLTTWSTGVEMDYCFAVERQDTVLYSILSKVTAIVPSSTINAALARYYTEDARTGIASSTTQVIVNIVICVLVVTALVGLIVMMRNTWSGKRGAEKRQRVPVEEDFALFDDLPISYSVYHVTHAEHSELYDAEIVYANQKFLQLGGLSSEETIGHHVRELFPYIGEEWFEDARRAAFEGETVEYDYTDQLSGNKFRFSARQVMSPGYCAITYMEA